MKSSTSFSAQSSSRFSDRYRNNYRSNSSFQPSTSSATSSSRQRSRSPPIYEGGVRVSAPSIRHRQEFTATVPPVRSFNKFNGQRYSRQPTFERRNRPELPALKRWHCPKREL